jgi:CheY-like chemotaxis protein
MTILYADDDDEDQEVFSEIIHAIDPSITILHAKDGLHTIELLSTGDAPSIIFLDFNMPFLNGHQTVLQIRKEAKYKNTKVIIFSTHPYERAFEEFASLNVRYARKPNTIQEGIVTLKAIIQETAQ